MSIEAAWDSPLWLWRQHADWQDAHIDALSRNHDKGAFCGNC